MAPTSEDFDPSSLKGATLEGRADYFFSHCFPPFPPLFSCLHTGSSQTSDAFQPSMQGLGFLGEEEDRDGRNVRFGFPSFDEKMEDAPSSHRDVASTPAPQEEAGVEWREEGQMSWVREKYLRLYPRGAPGDGGSRSPLGLVSKGGKEGEMGLGEDGGVLRFHPTVVLECMGTLQF